MLNLFGERVTLRITQLGINRSDLAKRLKTPPSVVSKTLNQRRNPREKTIAAWAIALETTTQWLLGMEPLEAQVAPPPQLSQKAMDALIAHAESIGINNKKLSAFRLILAAEPEELRLACITAIVGAPAETLDAVKTAIQEAVRHSVKTASNKGKRSVPG